MSSYIPESVRLKEKRDALLKAKQVAEALKKENSRDHYHTEYVKRAERYILEYQQKEKEEIERNRMARNKGLLISNNSNRLVFVIRIRGINEVPPKPKKVLELFRLLQINNGVFVRLNESTRKMLEIISPYVAFGYPSVNTVRNLIYKRGFARVNKQRVPVSTNELVAEHLKQFDIICVEDLVHEIYTVGEHFKEANNFLWPFKLNAPTGGYKNVKKQFNEGGDTGNREYLINGLIARML
ncbi:uncharacterized protein [Blastocystis hominis]|uniref:Ribosomal protein L30 ferredoxin-like fold domain-containing protein n=1 Tax=Blastocystis hominis TaxID=12968 RepID=D8M4Y2_BLAHO|nr:uncharacterized protein [Blastocystis hominis]CBK23121.2 unnamed protein product [Blastocystis hominis]|eukprot:XP_012897169.1 uncharacterized protein [Blastocystis hominis]